MKTLLAAILLALPILSADQTPAAGPVKAACGSDDVKFSAKPAEGRQTAPQPEPGKALVYVVEQEQRTRHPLSGITVRVGMDGSWMGAARNASYLFFSVEPGEHHLCADWQSPTPWIGKTLGLTNLRVEPGQTYYVRARFVAVGVQFLALDLDRINPDEGRLLVETSPLSDYRQKK